MNKRSTAPNRYEFGLQYIAGDWRQGRSSAVIRDTNPYNGETLLELIGASVADVDEAYDAAERAQSSWADMAPRDRAEVLRNAADVIEARREEIVEATIREVGGVRAFAEIIWYFAWSITAAAADYPARMRGEILPTDVPGQESRVYRKLLGIITVISPWNSPINLTLRSLAPALALGNAVVIKPASDTPITGGLMHARIFEEARLPSGLLSVLVGESSEIGDAVVTHPGSHLVSFTGSTGVGRSLYGKIGASPTIKRLALELGGNAPFVVLDDADLDQAVNSLVVGRFLHQGQICMSANRAIVDSRVHDAFVERLVAKVSGLKIGDPNDGATVVGPLINGNQVKSALSKIERAKAEGARVLTGGPMQGSQHNIIPPHVFVDVEPHHAIAREESFGPLLPVLKARDEAHALQLANDSEYGLSSAVFTRDIERGVAFVQRLRVGMSHANDHPIADAAYAPFGGERNSGIGRFNAEWIIDEYTRTDDGRPRSLQEFTRDALGHERFTSIDRVANDGLDLVGHFHSDQWGDFRTHFNFQLSPAGKIVRLDIGQAT